MLRAARRKTVIALLTVLSFTVFNIIPVYAVTFWDISAHWAQDSILRLAALQIVNGYNGRFNPNAGVTRAEFAAMIVKAMGLADQAEVVKGGSTGYRDVPPSHWASGFVIVAKEKGMISGYPDGTFQPGAMIRRDEITSVLVRALKLLPADDMEDPVQVFADGDSIPGWAREAVKTAFDYKLISGYPDGHFFPDRKATRGETAALIEKVLAHLGTQFTFFGRVQMVDDISRLLTLNIHGQIESFPYKAAVEVRINGKPGTVNSLKPDGYVFVIIDDNGYISFIETAETGVQDPVITGASESRQAVSLGYAGWTEDSRYQERHVTALVVTRRGSTAEISDLVKSRGGTVEFINENIDFVLAEITEGLFRELQSHPLVEEITPDGVIEINSLLTGEGESGGTAAEENPGRSLNVTREAIKAPAYVGLTHADGKGQVIAIIDTGIDPGHPDLQKTSDNKRKITEWRDFTGEGNIDTSSTVKPEGKYLNLANDSYYIGEISSASGTYRYGYLREIDLRDVYGKSGYDFNFNGKKTDIFAVLVTDSLRRGVYDTVYIDTNGDKDFTDQTPLNPYAGKAGYESFVGNDGKDQLNIVLTEINSDGSQINLGFDGNDHGTLVAGIAAANGKIKGVAPGAQVMALKVLDTAGYGSLGAITKAMSYAASRGARIINLSLGFPVSDHNGGSVPAKLLNNLTEEFGVIFVVAAGNDGPGLSTVATPGDAAAALSVGAFNTPEMWKTDYGWDVPEANLWWFSSAGPRRDGAVSPSVVAPGSAVSTVPLRNGKKYFLSEGTSIAAPHASGAIALLMEVAQRNRLNVSPAIIKRAVESGAQPISGYSAAEQGYGAINLPMSWAELLSLKNESPVTVETTNLETGKGAGIFFREGVPQKLTLYLKNNSNINRTLNLDSSPWVTPDQSVINIPPGKTRAVDIELSVPEEKGLYSAFISGKNPTVYGTEFEALATVVNPYNFSGDNGRQLVINDSENAAQYKRYFFKILPGADSIQARLIVPGGNGRSKVYLFNPKGQLIDETDFAGVNVAGSTEEVSASGDSPMPGVWEVVVYSSAALSAYNLNRSDYRLVVSLQGANIGQVQQESRNVIVGILPKVLRAGRTNYVTVQVRDRYTKKPYQGFIEINGRIYFTHRGRVVLPADLGDEGLDLVVRTVPQSQLLRPSEFGFTLLSG